MGRFELVSRLGMGAFRRVWKARDKQLDRTVAIKIPRQAAMTPPKSKKNSSAKPAPPPSSAIPNIVSVHEVGRDGDSVYIVSDFVRGVTLGDWLTGQQLTSREAAELCAKIADALHHAHEQGVVHRDLKPANIMIDGDGEPHLMDFGLARREVGEVTVTIDGQVLGTPAYMSPEQAQGEVPHGRPPQRRLFAGRDPFPTPHRRAPLPRQRADAHAPGHPRRAAQPAEARTRNVPRDLETICLKCLNKSPGGRYATAAGFAEDISRHLKGEPIQARPIGSLQRTWKWAKRNPAVAALVVTVISTLATLSGGKVCRCRHSHAPRATENSITIKSSRTQS